MANGDEKQLLEREFAAVGIDFNTPGFCDSQEFVAAEARAPDLRLKYGRYVRVRPYDEAYLERVRRRPGGLTNCTISEPTAP